MRDNKINELFNNNLNSGQHVIVIDPDPISVSEALPVIKKKKIAFNQFKSRYPDDNITKALDKIYNLVK